VYIGGDLSTMGRDLSTEGETCLLRVRLVYGGGGSSTEGKTRLQRARLFCGGTDSYTEGETSLWRGRLIFGGKDSSTEGEARHTNFFLTLILFIFISPKLIVLSRYAGAKSGHYHGSRSLLLINLCRNMSVYFLLLLRNFKI
jgi:hypothetical protein